MKNSGILFLEKVSKYRDVELMDMLSEPKPACDRAFQELYKRHSSRLNSFCMFKLNNKDDAEEIFQQTWIRFYNSVIGGKELECVVPFLLSIARNLIIDHFRSKKIKNNRIVDLSEPEMLEEIADSTAANHEVETTELSEIIQAAVNCLDEKYKEAFILKRYQDLSLNEIAELLDINLNTAKQRVSRATKMVREIIAPHINDYIDIK